MNIGNLELPLKVAVLTTKTPHHLYFLRQIREKCQDIVSLELVIVEEKPFPYRKLFLRHIQRNWYNPIQWVLFNPYLQRPYLTKEQNAYEMERFFPDGRYGYDEGVRIEQVWSVNNNKALTLLKENKPDICLVYGTGLVIPEVFGVPCIATVNLHGGFLPFYRGLDTNLWAALRGDYNKLAVALHRMDENFDTGPVLMLERLQSQHDMSLVTLRYYTTLLAIDMCVTMLQQLASGADIESKLQQPCEGKYYSYVPWLLKPLADWRLRRFARREKHGK